MKTLTLLAVVAGMQSVATAQTWQTVAQFQYEPNVSTVGFGIAPDPAQNLYAVGMAPTFGPDGLRNGSRALTIRSEPGGQSWALVDDVPFSNPRAVAASPFAVYTSGSEWLIRGSADGGASWSTIHQLEGDPYSIAEAMAADSIGNVYVAGRSGQTWHVRKSSDAGVTWRISDNFSNNGAFGEAHAIHLSSAGALWAGGRADLGKPDRWGFDQQAWVVRRSLDGGATWVTVDQTWLGDKEPARANGVCTDAAGNIYAAGVARKVTKGKLSYDHWLVRKSANGGSTWTASDLFHPLATDSSAANAMTVDSSGRVYVGGSLNGHWIVRRLNANGIWQTVDDYQLATGQGAFCKGLVGTDDGSVYATGSASNGAGSFWVIRKLSTF